MYEVLSYESHLNFSHLIPILFSVHLGQTMHYLFEGKLVIRNFYWSPLGPCNGIPRLCSDRLPLGPYNHHIRLNHVPFNKIHLVPGIPSFLDFFD